METKKTPFEIGKNYLIRTVTMAQAGKVKEIYDDFLVLENASWVADTGRFSKSLVDVDNFNEVEMFANDCIVGLSGIIDATEIGSLPIETK